jgi:hypothetical protein
LQPKKSAAARHHINAHGGQAGGLNRSTLPGRTSNGSQPRQGGMTRALINTLRFSVKP